MASYRDVEMLNQSLGRLGDSLLRNRMLAEQKAQRGQDNEFRERGLALDERRVKHSEDSSAADRDMRRTLLENTQAQQAIAQVRGQIDQITKLHGAGQLSTEEANAKIKQLRQSIEQGTNLILKESGLADFSLQDISKPDKDAKEIIIGGRKFAQTAGGALVPLDQAPPRPFSRTYADPNDPDARITERLTAEEYDKLRSGMGRLEQDAKRKRFNPATGRIE